MKLHTELAENKNKSLSLSTFVLRKSPATANHRIEMPKLFTDCFFVPQSPPHRTAIQCIPIAFFVRTYRYTHLLNQPMHPKFEYKRQCCCRAIWAARRATDYPNWLPRIENVQLRQNTSSPLNAAWCVCVCVCVHAPNATRTQRPGRVVADALKHAQTHTDTQSNAIVCCQTTWFMPNINAVCSASACVPALAFARRCTWCI